MNYANPGLSFAADLKENRMQTHTNQDGEMSRVTFNSVIQNIAQ